MKLIPVLTEKSLAQISENEYTFYVDRLMTKHQIREAVENSFGVKVVSVRTMIVKGEKKRTAKGKTRVETSRKKAIVVLNEKDKIDLFEEVGK